ncbi:MAG: hypothetical protein KDA91_20850 [Planctomycetaceae bacterium]|nr:hypothetical protein [Planctomycetaceae bacterium]
MWILRLAALTIVACSAPLQAQEFATLSNTYHVEVRIEHWRIGSGGWSTQYTTTDPDEAELVLTLFEIAMESGELNSILGLSWEWIITDVRIRTEYPQQLTEPVIQSPIRRYRAAYTAPQYGYPQP